MVVKNDRDCDDTKFTSSYPGAEQFGPDSKCISATVDGDQTALCMTSYCNEEEFTFDFIVEGKNYSCTQNFEEIEISGSSNDFVFECPRIPTVCPE